MQSVEEREGIFQGLKNYPHVIAPNPPVTNGISIFAIWFSAVWAALPVSLPVAVRRCRLCLYGGVLGLSLVRTVTLAGFVQPAGFILQ
jgi:hypothetical protein